MDTCVFHPLRNPRFSESFGKLGRWTSALGALIALATSASAESIKPLREARSENRLFTLSVENTSAEAARLDEKPDGADERAPADSQPASSQSDDADSSAVSPTSQPTSSAAAGVWATLRRTNRGERGDEIWRARLINRVAPVHAFISDDGRFTITLDDYPVGGARHAVVIYDDKGEMQREFSLRELLRKDDWKEVRERRGAIYWLRGAKMRFNRDVTEFRIDLRSDRRIVIDLRKLEIDGGAAAAGDVPPEFAAILDHPPQDADADTPQSLDDAIAQLRNVIAELGQGTTQDDLDEAHAIVETLLARLMAQSPPNEALIQQALEALGSPELVAHPPSDDASDGEPLAETDAMSASPFAGNSADAGVAVPMPNPKARVDYVSWMREQTTVDGDSATPIVAAAVAKLAKWDGDPELRDRAMKGDPVALQSPEIQAWLAANQDSIELAWKASELPYRGVQPQEDADSLIGVLLPDLGARREITRAAIVRGRVLESQGDVAGARREYMNAMRFGAQTGQGATLIENLVGAAIQQPSANALLDSFENDDSTDFAATAAELERGYQPLRPASEIVQFERAMILEQMQQVYQHDAATGEYRADRDAVEALTKLIGTSGKDEDGAVVDRMTQTMNQIGFEAMLSETNGLYDQFTQASGMPFMEAQATLTAITEHVENDAMVARNPFVAVLVPSLSRANQLTTRAESQRRATLLVANLKAYKQQHGTYPPSLDVFGGRDWATDPLTAQPYRYEPSDENFRLYSLGLNGSDDGGTHDPAGRESDTVFWPRP